MASVSKQRLEQVIARFEQVEARMGVATETDEIVALSKEHAELRPVAEKAMALRSTREGLEEAEAMIAGDDPEMAELAREEADNLRGQLPDLNAMPSCRAGRLKLSLSPRVMWAAIRN